jgi:pyridoxal 5'-phosphate synthase pdxS subunit
VANFAAGGVATPADAALMMQLGAEGVFVGSGIFKSGNPQKRAAAIVQAVTNYQDANLQAELSEDLGKAMIGINEHEIELLTQFSLTTDLGLTIYTRLRRVPIQTVL